MAKVVNDYEFKRVVSASKYPWSEWLDGRTWKLTQGEDFTADYKSFRGAAYKACHSRGLKLKMNRSGKAVYVRAVAKGESATIHSSTDSRSLTIR